MPTVLVKEFFRNFSGIFPEKFRASYFSGKVTTLLPSDFHNFWHYTKLANGA